MTGEIIGGRYQLIAEWRNKNLCQTYLAEDTHLPGNPRCVVKRLQFENPALSFVQTLRRLFDNEAKALYNLGTHPQIPKLLAHLEENRDFYLVQELIRGEDLSKREIPHQQWSESQVIDFLGDVLEVLVFVHGKNVIHRDIKPSNLIRRESDGKIVLIDFGSIKEITTTIGNTTITIGTPAYMPTEQIGGHPRFCSDIYALGMTAIAAVTGVEPLYLHRDKQGETIWRDRANLSPKLADILDKMVRYHFTDRYQSAREVLDDLQQLRLPPSPPPPPFPWKKYVGVAIAVTALLGVSLSLIIPHVNRTLKVIELYNEANQLSDDKEYAKAIAAFDAALKIMPDFAEAWADRGYALGQLGEHQDQFSSCDRAILLDSQLTEAWNCRGLARHSLGQYDRAIADYEDALKIDPKFHPAWYNKGDTLLQIKELRAALASFKEALKIKPDYLFAWNLKCKAHFELKEYQQAEIACEEALKIDPNYGPPKQRLPWVRQQLGK